MLTNFFSNGGDLKSRNSHAQLEAASNDGMARFATQETELNSYKSSSLHLKAPRKTVPKLDLKKVFEVAQ